MAKSLKLWASLGVAAATGVALAGSVLEAAAPDSNKNHMTLADNSGEGGEAGESGASGAPAEGIGPVLLDVSFVEGHMTVGVELFKQGDQGAAVHMKHPADELFAALLPKLEELQLSNFATELDAVSRAVETAKPAGDVDALFQVLLKALDATRGTHMEKAEVAVPVAVGLLRQAVAEFDEGVEGGKIVNAKEYQDAWGFVVTARRLLAALPAKEREEYKAPLAEIEAELVKLPPLWPDITGKTGTPGDTGLFAGTVARIELAASAIK